MFHRIDTIFYIILLNLPSLSSYVFYTFDTVVHAFNVQCSWFTTEVNAASALPWCCIYICPISMFICSSINIINANHQSSHPLRHTCLKETKASSATAQPRYNLEIYAFPHNILISGKSTTITQMVECFQAQAFQHCIRRQAPPCYQNHSKS